jgi:hypothetical protein
MTMLETLINDAFMANAGIKTAQALYAEKLNAIVAHLGSSTFEHNSKWFQIRTRKFVETGEIITYLCDLKAEPRTWLKGRPKGVGNKKKAASFDAVSTSTDPVIMANAAFNAMTAEMEAAAAGEVNSDTVIE